MNRTRELLIIDAWKPIGKEAAGAAELEFIQNVVLQRFGTAVSPATIARALADYGVRLNHPEILQADVRCRERSLFFTAEDLTLGTPEAATALMNKLETLRQQFATEKPVLEELYRQVRRIKGELELIGSSLTLELAQWLAVWLQNPVIFKEWLELRLATAEFREGFQT